MTMMELVKGGGGAMAQGPWSTVLLLNNTLLLLVFGETLIANTLQSCWYFHASQTSPLYLIYIAPLLYALSSTILLLHDQSLLYTIFSNILYFSSYSILIIIVKSTLKLAQTLRTHDIFMIVSSYS